MMEMTGLSNSKYYLSWTWLLVQSEYFSTSKYSFDFLEICKSSTAIATHLRKVKGKSSPAGLNFLSKSDLFSVMKSTARKSRKKASKSTQSFLYLRTQSDQNWSSKSFYNVNCLCRKYNEKSVNSFQIQIINSNGERKLFFEFHV